MRAAIEQWLCLRCLPAPLGLAGRSPRKSRAWQTVTLFRCSKHRRTLNRKSDYETALLQELFQVIDVSWPSATRSFVLTRPS